MRGSARLAKGLLLCGVAAVAVALAAPKPAAARGFVHFGIGVPLGPAYYPPPVYYPAYPPPPVYYPAYPAPVYEPPPAIAYAPPETYAPPSHGESAPPAGECREYTAISRIGGRAQQIVGTACLQADGTWRIIR